MKVTDFIKADTENLARFERFRHGHLYYSVQRLGTNELYEFPVPIEDIQEATFNKAERSVTMMRYIRKAIEGNTLIHLRNLPDKWICEGCNTEQQLFFPVVLDNQKLCGLCSAERQFCHD